MAKLYAAFQEAAGTDRDATINSPGVEGIEFLLKAHEFKTSLEKVKQEFDDLGWTETTSLSWTDFQQLAVKLGIDQAEETVNGSEDDRAHELAQPVSGIVGTIATRMAEQTFPYVHPNEVGDGQNSNEAEAILEYMQKAETVEVQSFIDEARAQHAASNPGDDSLPREAKDAQWMRERFYPLMREFFYTKALKTKKFSHRSSECGLVPLVAMASIEDDDEREEAAAAVKKTTESYIPTFDGKLWEEWKKTEDVLEYVDEPAKEVFATFLDKNYFQILKQCVDAVDAQCVKPKYPVSCNNASIEESEAREILLSKLSKADLETVEDKVRERWSKARLEFPTYIKENFKQDPPETFWVKNYYSTMSQLFDYSNSSTESVEPRPSPIGIVEPRLPINADGTPEEIEKRRTWVSQLTQDKAEQLDSTLKQEWKGRKEELKAKYGLEVSDDPTMTFVQQNYYRLMEDMFQAKPAIDIESDKEDTNVNTIATSHGAPVDVMGSWMSDAVETVASLEQKESEYVSALDLQRRKFTGVHWKYEGYVMDAPSIQTRTVTTGSNSKRKASNEKIVVDCILYDRTGAVSVSLWDAAADEFMRIVSTHPAEKRLIIELEHFCVQPLGRTDWNGTSVTTINILKSVASTDSRVMTQVRVCTETHSPYNHKTTGFVIPDPPIALHQFQNLKTQALPFRGTFVGTVTNVGELEYSTNGQPKRAFHIVDDLGYWFPCCACGYNAACWRTPENTKAVIYFGSARTMNQETSFILYVFRDGLIVPITTVPSAPAKRVDVSTRT